MKKIFIVFIFSTILTGCATSKNHNSMKQMNTNNLASQIAYGDKISNKVVFDGSNYKMLVFALKSDQVLKSHSAPMDAPLYMLEGSATITIGNEKHILEAGDLITLPKDINHGVYPITDCKFMLLK
ncbi:MAG: cupin domain-containing protein [Nonlabens sp.]|nr:cupin domain-containing protein [Nonlabens sp.]